MEPFDLKEYELNAAQIHRNLPASALYEHAIRYEKDASIAENGALVAYSGAKTGRSPKDKRVVKNPASEKDIWWGNVNIPLEGAAFAINRERARDYLNTRERLYCFDGFAGWDPKYSTKIRVICSRPYRSLFWSLESHPKHWSPQSQTDESDTESAPYLASIVTSDRGLP
jgi:phosphoenolpyruvate carboxykinase (ATP)